MTAVARDLSSPPAPRLVPPRPTPKSGFPPPLPASPSTVTDEVHEVSDTSIHEVSELREAHPEPKRAAKPPSLPPSAMPAVLAREPRATHPGLVLARTIGFFVAQLGGDAFRSARAFLKAHWVRASARAHSSKQ